MFNERMIKVSLAIGLLLMMLLNGLYYMMPYSVTNPFQYFTASELTQYHLLNMFVASGTTFISIVFGFLIGYISVKGRKEMLIQGVILLIGFLLVGIFIFGFEPMIFVVSAALVSILFVRANWMVLVIASVVLYITYIMANIVPTYLSVIGSNYDMIYSAIQQISEYTRVFSSADYFAIVQLNLSIVFTDFFLQVFQAMFTLLPWVLLGIFTYKINLMEVIREHTFAFYVLFATILLSSVALKLIQILTLGTYSGILISENIAEPLLAAAYFMLIGLLLMIIPQRITCSLEALGEKPLSFYILSHIVMFIIYYGVGFSYYGDTSVGDMTLTVFLIYVLMLIVAVITRRSKISLEHLLFTQYDKS